VNTTIHGRKAREKPTIQREIISNQWGRGASMPCTTDVDVGCQLVEEIALIEEMIRAKISDVMMEIADRALQLEGWFLGES
jgi:hypothetical protein